MGKVIKKSIPNKAYNTRVRYKIHIIKKEDLVLKTYKTKSSFYLYHFTLEG
jgi:hypothetical protein